MIIQIIIFKDEFIQYARWKKNFCFVYGITVVYGITKDKFKSIYFNSWWGPAFDFVFS